MRRFTFSVRKIHRWLTLLFGLQLILWSISGALMVLLPLAYVHGNHLVRAADQPIREFQLLQAIPQAITENPNITEIELVNRFIGNELQHVFVVTSAARKYLISPLNGQPITLVKEDVRELALMYYAPRVQQENIISSISLLTEEAPSELNPRHLPAWQVQFNDKRHTTFYLHTGTGELLTKRHRAWRWFDTAWMLHIMDYQDRSNTGQPWAIAFMILTLFTAFTGFIMLLQRLVSRPWRRLWAE